MSKRRQSLGIQLILAIAFLGLIGYLFVPSYRTKQLSDHLFDQIEQSNYYQQHQQQQHHHHQQQQQQQHHSLATHPARVKAAFVILARNRELQGIRQSIRQLEDRFNRHFNYPYVFLNEEYFTDEFKEKTSDLTKAQTFYGKIDESMWGYPDYINQTHAAECRKQMEEKKVIYGGSESYRHMCRFQSGFFFRHPLLDQFEYYWRVEPDVQFFCDIDYDVFQMMKDNDYKYGWTISLTEYKETIPTLWETTKAFMKKYPEWVNRGKESLMGWLTDDDFETYNGCHFWSNFEIGSLEFFRSERYLKFFDFLDRQGGFFYERWGDAPVHSLAVAMMLNQSEVHFFHDIGYKHNPLMHCPIEPWLQKNCWCNDKENFDWTDWSCATRYSKIQPDFAWSESTYKDKTKAYRIHS